MKYSGKIYKVAIILLGLFFVNCLLGQGALLAEEGVEYEKFKGGLGTLIGFSRSRAHMVQEYKEETQNYNKIKKALDRNYLKEGESASTIKRRYGEPVITLFDERGSTTKWVYKPAEVSYSSSKKVYLTFDENDKLVEWISLQPVDEDSVDSKD